jgi:hypothetical protein
MNIPKFITFTGLDERTNFHRLRLLSNEYPIEWGILFMGIHNGNRYTGVKVLDKILELRKQGIAISSHLCGFYAYSALVYNETPDALKGMVGLNREFNRIQINRNGYAYNSLARLKKFINRPVIVQTRKSKFPSMMAEIASTEPTIPGIYHLQDASNGKGIETDEWPEQLPHMPFVGYAGGIGPNNIAATLDTIKAHNFWIDMETNIRTNDWLDLDKCEYVCQIVYGRK